MPLSALGVKNAKPKAKPYRLSDGKGLYLIVTEKGSKLWRFNYSLNGKRNTMSFGKWPEIELADVRKMRDQARRLVATGRLPLNIRRSRSKPALSWDRSFEAIARDWYASKELGWTTRYAALVLGRLEADVFPHLGQEDIDEIEPPRLLEVIHAIEARGAIEMARRVNDHCSCIFQYGIAINKCRWDPANNIRNALMNPRPKQHRLAVPPSEFPGLLAKLKAYDGDEVTKLALRFTLLTMVRTQETRFAKWTEFEGLDGNQALWRLSPERMKMSREHLVPLSRQVIGILSRLKEISSGSPYLFAADSRHGVMSENTMLFALYRMGYHSRQTTHGLRRCASTILNESGQFEPDWIETQLAHLDRNKTRGAYNAAIYFRHRAGMLQWWADFVDRQGEPHPLPAQHGQIAFAEAHDPDAAAAASTGPRADNLIFFPR